MYARPYWAPYISLPPCFYMKKKLFISTTRVGLLVPGIYLLCAVFFERLLFPCPT